MDLGGKAASALRWSGGVTFLSQLATWAMTIFVIRILSPEDFGLMAIAMMFVGFLMLVNELGMGAVLVQKEQIDTGIRQKVFGVTLILNTGFFVLAYTGSPLIADFFAEPRLAEILRTLSTLFVIYAFEIVPLAQLERDLDFKRKSLVYLFANVTGGMVSLTLAILGFGVWALVGGTLWIAVSKTIGINLVSPFWHLPSFRFAGMRSVFTFGGLVTLERALWFLYSQADIFVIGKLLGKRILGFYSVAMDLAALIMHKTGGVLYEVSFPTFSRAQQEPERLSRYFLKAVRIMSFLSFPMFFGISSISPEIVDVLLGEKWQPSELILTILALIMPLRMISNLFPPALQGVGRPGTSVGNLIIAIVLMPAAFVIGTRWGAVGVAVAWCAAFPVVFLIITLRSRKPLGIDLRQFAKAMVLPLMVSIAMFAAVYGVRALLGDLLPPAIRLVALIGVGGAVYGGIMLLFARDMIDEVLGLLRR